VRFRPAFLAAILLGAFSNVLAVQNAAVPIHRVLMNVELGTGINDVKKTYPPIKPWPMTRELNGRVVRIQLQRPDSKVFPIGVDRISLRVLGEQVIMVKAVFDAAQTRKESLADLVRQLAAQYGEPRRIGMTYGWQDDHTLLKAYDEPLPLPKSKGVELRTAVEIVDLDAYPSLQP